MRKPFQLLKDAWGIFTSNPRLFIGIYLVPGIITFTWAIFSSRIDEKNIGSSLPDLAISIFLLLALVVSGILMGIAMMKAVSNPRSDLSVGELYSEAKNYFWSYIWIAIIMTCAIIGGFILLIIPGIIFAVWFVFSYYVLLFEDKKGASAMKASKAYVKGKWWGIFGRYVFLALVSVAVSFVISIFSTILESGLENLGNAIVSFAANAVIVPVAVAYSYLMYKDVSSITNNQETAV